MRASLSTRLLIAASISIIAALVATAIVLKYFFAADFEERLQDELGSHLANLTGETRLGADGEIVVSSSLDPRFNEPLSGFYWQVRKPGEPPVLSASFWFEPLEIPVRDPADDIEFGSRRTSSGDNLMTGNWTVSLLQDGGDQNLQFVVAIDRQRLDETISDFSRNVAISLGVLGLFLVIASWVQVRFGLRPLEAVRRQLGLVRASSEARISRNFPAELMPLVDEVNSLLDQQEMALTQARARASDMAHGLKTPLTIMQALSRDLKQTGQHGISDDIDHQINAIRHFVERELARTRDHRARESWCTAKPVVDRLVSAFARQNSEKPIKWEVDVPPQCSVPYDEFALTELLGNLIDNAAKWTTDWIGISMAGDRSAGTIDISDNGPGVDPDRIPDIQKRGGRLDEVAPGQGLGLAIVKDMVDHRGGKLAISRGPQGGLRVTITWGAS